MKAQLAPFAAFVAPSGCAKGVHPARVHTTGVNDICLRYEASAEQPDDVKAVAGMTPRQIPD